MNAALRASAVRWSPILSTSFNAAQPAVIGSDNRALRLEPTRRQLQCRQLVSRFGSRAASPPKGEQHMPVAQMILIHGQFPLLIGNMQDAALRPILDWLTKRIVLIAAIGMLPLRRVKKFWSKDAPGPNETCSPLSSAWCALRQRCGKVLSSSNRSQMAAACQISQRSKSRLPSDSRISVAALLT